MTKHLGAHLRNAEIHDLECTAGQSGSHKKQLLRSRRRARGCRTRHLKNKSGLNARAKSVASGLVTVQIREEGMVWLRKCVHIVMTLIGRSTTSCEEVENKGLVTV